MTIDLPRSLAGLLAAFSLIVNTVSAHHPIQAKFDNDQPLTLTGEITEVDRANPHGLLDNIADAPRVAPFQAWAEDLYILRQRHYLEDDPMFLNCMPPGGPRQFQMSFPLGVQFVEQRRRDRIFVLMDGGNSNWRLIHTGGQEASAIQPTNDDRLFYGRSRGRWEGDTLVVETSNFNETFWFSNGGLPHTSELQLTERFTRTDRNTLE